MKIELLPKAGRKHGLSDISKTLGADFKGASYFQGAVAFYTIKTLLLNGNNILSQVLKDERSFFCADINLPTDIDMLNKLYSLGCKVYLHIFKLNERGNNHVLMHTKLLLFNRNNEVVIWNGSHNWTNSALKGPNIEASTRIEINSNDNYVSEVTEYLTMIRSICDLFDPRNIDFYKMLQNMSGSTAGKGDGGGYFMCATVSINNFNELVQNIETKVFHCLSIDENEYSVLKTNSKKIYIYFKEITTEKYFLTACEIMQVGKIDRNNPQTFNKTFPQRKYFFRGLKEGESIMKGPDFINSEKLKELNYHVELKIIAHAADYNATLAAEMQKKNKEIWKDEPQSLHMLRASTDMQPSYNVKHGIVKDINSETLESQEGKIFTQIPTQQELFNTANEISDYFENIKDEDTAARFHSKVEELLIDKKGKFMVIKSFHKYFIWKK